VPEAGVLAGGPAGVDDVGPDGVPAGFPVPGEESDVGAPVLLVVLVCPPPAGVTSVQLIVLRTEFAFGWPSDAIFALQRPGKAFELGPLPCLFELTVVGAAEELEEEVPEEELPEEEVPEEDPDPNVLFDSTGPLP
jgi:hypothetical protein